MSDNGRIRHVENVIDAYRKQVDRGVNPREAHHQIVMDVASKSSPSTRVEAQHLADSAIKTYAAKLVDRSPGDAMAETVRAVTKPREVGLDVKNYTRTVLNSVGKSSNADRVVLAHAASAADGGRAGLKEAARVAQTAVREYGELRQRGVDHIAAREQVAKNMGERFDNRGHDMQRQERQRSRSMGL